MDIIPPVQTSRFEQLEPGDLFIYLEGGAPSYALKTLPLESGDRSMMALLGPSFTQEPRESLLVSWQATTVLSVGKEFSILPSLDAASWSSQGPSRAPVCLAVAEGETYICANASPLAQRYLPHFINVKTGAIRASCPRLAVFSSTWAITTLSGKHRPRLLIRYPLR